MCGLSHAFAEKAWDTMLEPLVAKQDFRRRFDDNDTDREAWRSLAEEPWRGDRALPERFAACGLPSLTDARIRSDLSGMVPSLLQNQLFLTTSSATEPGEWKVPVGRNGKRCVRELEQAARKGGAEEMNIKSAPTRFEWENADSQSR